MNVSQSFKMALKSLRASKLRSLLTMLGIIIGVAAVIVILSLGNGVTGMVNQQVENLGVNLVQTTIYGVGDGTTMNVEPQTMYDLVEAHPDVLSGVSPYLTVPAAVRSGNTEYEGTTVYGVSEAVYRPETNSTLDGCALAEGRFLQYVDVVRRQNVCVLGAYLAQDAFRGDALGRSISIAGREFTVVGVLEPLTDHPSEDSLDNQIYLPYENAMELAGARQVSLYLFTSTSGSTAAAAKALIDETLFAFFQNQDAYYTTTMAEQAELIDSMMAVVMAVLVAIAAISLLVGGIGIMNIMLVSVTERTREIGIRKSLGAKRRDIRRQFVIEAGTTSAIGGLLGILTGCLMATGIGSLIGGMLTAGASGTNAVTFSAAPTLGAVAVSFGVSVGIGVLFGSLPAGRAARLNPIDALRHE